MISMHWNKQKTIMSVGAVIVVLTGAGIARAQQVDAGLGQRVENLENYVSTIQPTLVELSDNFNNSIRKYTDSLEQSLEDYSLKLQRNIDARLNLIDNDSIVLNPYSKAFQSIQTNAGVFLIAVEEVQQLEGGVRLRINIGNPSYADFQGVKMTFMWGPKYQGPQGISYDEWRQSLRGVVVTFDGKVQRGKWSSLEVDLSPVSPGGLVYLECEMEVSSAELGI